MALKDNRRDLLKLTKQYGFVLHRKNKHYVFKHSSGKTLVCSTSCTDWRALKNVERDIKRLLSS
jgi:predicted RNA binding protein YcfA (HicA-like mRNA interferase family)